MTGHIGSLVCLQVKIQKISYKNAVNINVFDFSYVIATTPVADMKILAPIKL